MATEDSNEANSGRIPVDFFTANGMTPLMFCAQLGDVQGVQALLKSGAQVDKISEDGRHTSLTLAALNNRVEAARVLACTGVGSNIAPPNSRRTALMIAADAGYVDVIEALAACELDYESEDGETALHVACKAGQVGAVHKILELGADVNYESKRGENVTALMCAMKANAMNIIEELVRQNAHVNYENSQGETRSFMQLMVPVPQTSLTQ